MKRKFLIILLAIISVVACALSVTACNVGNSGDNSGGTIGGSSSEENPDTDNVSEDTPDIDNDSEEQPTEDFDNAVEEWNNFLAAISSNNFVCTILDEEIFVCENIIEIGDVFYENIEVQQFKYEIKSDDHYHKSVYDIQENIDYFKKMDDIFDILDGVEWNILVENKVLNGVNSVNAITFEKTESNYILFINEYEFQFFNIGTVTINLPEELIDDTQSDNLRDEQGNFNYVILADVLTEVQNDESIKKILYINISDGNGLNFGTYRVTDAGKLYYWEYRISEENWEKVKFINTKDELISSLNFMKGAISSTGVYETIEYSTYDYTAEQKAEFDAMTKRIFTELDIDGLDEKNVKFAFKTPFSGETAAASSGWLYATGWSHYYLIEINGHLEFLGVSVSASTSQGDGSTGSYSYSSYNCAVFNVINNTEKQMSVADNNYESKLVRMWHCSSEAITLLQEDNKDFYIGTEIIQYNSVVVDGVKYLINNGVATVAGLSNTLSGNINLPNTITFNEVEYRVTRIGNGAFKDCNTLTCITIGKWVTNIGGSAFSGCSGLTDVTMPNGVDSFGEYAFYNCSKLKNLTIPNSITSIGINAFYGCDELVYNEYENVLYLGNNNNPYLVLVKQANTVTSLKINSNAKIICAGAFSGSGITNLNIPDNITSIDGRAFIRCSELASITVSQNNKLYKSVNNCLLTQDGKLLLLGCKNSIIPDCVTTIGEYAFYYCSGLTSITIPNSVKRIGWRAFSGCSGLTKMVIPNSVISIGAAAFENCSSLESITLPFIGETKDGTNNIAFQFIFSGASTGSLPTSLKQVIISEGLTHINNMAFYNCRGLTSITIPNSVTSIGMAAFERCVGLTSITIPNGVTSIGSSAFEFCSGLTSITIPNGVTSIGDYAFQNCSGLTSITISDGVTSIGDYAFSYCSGLTSVTIPDSVTSIGKRAFYNCSALTNVTLKNTSSWKVSTKVNMSGATSLSSSNLSTTSMVATYLTSTYSNYYWERG